LKSICGHTRCASKRVHTSCDRKISLGQEQLLCFISTSTRIQEQLPSCIPSRALLSNFNVSHQTFSSPSAILSNPANVALVSFCTEPKRTTRIRGSNLVLELSKTRLGSDLEMVVVVEAPGVLVFELQLGSRWGRRGRSILARACAT
jgi:hypothetical protein